MAIVTPLPGGVAIKDSYTILDDNSNAINNQVIAHVAGTDDKHSSKDVLDNSAVPGVNQEEVNNALNAVDEDLQIQIQNIELADSNALIGVYKGKDLVNTNDYVVTIGTGASFNEQRVNLEVGNDNTGASTCNYNGEGAKEIVWRQNEIDYPAEVSMISGITQLQRDTAADKWVLINKKGAVESSEINQIASVEQVGGPYKDSVLDGGRFAFAEVACDSVVQSVKNNRFNGTSEWTPTNATLSEISNVLNITADGSAALGYADQEMFASVEDDKIYSSSAIRVTSSVCTRMRMYLLSSSGVAIDVLEVLNPNQNEWYYPTEKITVPAAWSGNVTVRFIHYYADAGTANGKVMEVEAGVLAINLTAMGRTAFSAQNAYDYYANRGLVFGRNDTDGSLVITGTNQFDVNDVYLVEDATVGQIAKGIQVLTSGNFGKVEYRFKLPSSSEITFKTDISKVGGDTPTIAFRNQEGVKYSTDLEGTGEQTKSFTTGSSDNEVRIEMFGSLSSATPQTTIFDLIQLEIGTTATAWQEYLKQFLAIAGKGLPNGKADLIYPLLNNAVDIVSDEFTFDGTESWGSYSNGNGTSNNLSLMILSGFGTSNNLINGNALGVIDYGIGHDGVGDYKAVNTSAILDQRGFLTTDGLFIYVPTVDLPTDDLAGFKSYLGTNNLALTCELAVPQGYTISGFQFQSFKGGVAILDTIAEFNSKVVFNQSAQIDSLSKGQAQTQIMIKTATEYIGKAKIDTGIVNELIITAEKEPTINDVFTIVASIANTAACTVKVNEGAVVALEKIVAGTETALASADLVANEMYTIRFTGSKYLIKI